MHPAGERDHLPRPPSQSDKLIVATDGTLRYVMNGKTYQVQLTPIGA
jgi:hypothetical protein